MFDKLVTKVSAIDTRGFVLKTQYDFDNSDVEQKLMMLTKKYIPDTSGFVKKDYNA